MSTDIAQLPEVRAALGDVDTLEQRLANYKVVNAEQFEAGATDLMQVKAAQKKLEDTRLGITRPMNEAIKQVLNLFRAPGDRLAAIERTIKRELGAFAERLEKLRLAEQAVAQEKARKEQERLEARAAAAAAAGKIEKAEELQERAQAVVAPVISREPPKVIGISQRVQWKFLVEKAELVPREFLCVDESKVRQYVNAMKGDARIAGVKIWSEGSYAARAAGSPTAETA
ncbi:MAG: hypothetical protein V4457_06085 [Pseudomonadota bacterium]